MQDKKPGSDRSQRSPSTRNARVSKLICKEKPMMNGDSIKPDLMVHARGLGGMKGAASVHIGTVDHMDGEQWIKLKRQDAQDSKHHWIPLDWVERADDRAVYLSKTADEVKKGMKNESPIGMKQ
jgi:hypothetical protein